ncbi:MAG: hypothetical protein IBX68_10515 [Dehalococcoidia bacterium]|nr:hypothetical protein [Dehalococcoidia bacterium]
MMDTLRKNSRFVALIAIVIILVVVNFMLYQQSQAAGEEKETLEKSKSAAMVSLTAARDQYDVVKLRQEDAALGSMQFPTQHPVVDLAVFIADGGPRLQVNIVEVGPFTSASETLAGKAYPAYQSKIRASSGSLSNLIGLLKYLEGGYFSSLKIKDVAFSGGPGGWEATFTVVIISQN